VPPAFTESLAVDAEDLLPRCRAGDLRAWRELYHRHVPLVYRVARRMGVPDCDFPDVCQEVFLRVHRGLDRFRGDAQFSTWLYRIVLHEVTRHGRSRALWASFLALLGRWPDERTVPEPGAGADASGEFQRLLDRLKPKHRQAFVLHELEQLSLEEIAEVAGCPLETVRSRLRHARAIFSQLCRQRRLALAREER
jgi:RNA polymerase sigma-70 factor (ECF subfamily)